MKAIGSAFNDLDFVIDSFQATGVKREPAMTDNAIGISLKHFGKSHQGPHPAFTGHRAPGVEEVPRTSGIFIIPEFFQIVFQKIDRQKGLIHLKQRFELGLFFLSKVFSVLQQKILAALDHVFILFHGISVFPVANGVNHSAKGTDDMKLIEDDRRLRKAFLHRLDVRIPHVHGNGFNGCFLLIGEGIKERFERLVAPVLSDPKNPAGLPVDNHGQIMMPFSQRDLIHGQKLRDPDLFSGIFFLKMLFMKLFYRLPVQIEMTGNIPNGQKPAQLQNITGQSPGYSQMKIHEPEVFNNDTAPAASDLPVTVSNPRLRLENVHVTDHPAVIGMNPLSGSLANVTYRPVASIRFYRYPDFLASAVKELMRYSNSTKLKKSIKLDSGHCKPPLDWIFVAKNLYPACFVMSIIF